MKIKVESLKDSQKLIKIEVDSERVKNVLDGVFGDIQKKARVPGFRPGKAPRDIVETQYDKTAREEALNHLVWDCYREAITTQKIDPAGYPVIENVDFDKERPLTFSARVDVKPDFKLKNYKGISVSEKSSQVTDEDIDASLKNLQESMAEYKNIDARPIAMNDYLVCDYECISEGKQVDKNDKLWLYINDKLKPKELLDGLIGAEIGVPKEIAVVHPKDYQHKELAGKKGTYKITPKELKEKNLPEINDDLAKSAGPFKDLEDLKKNARQRLMQTKKSNAQYDLEDQIFKALLKNHTFDVPTSIVDRQTERLVEDTKMKLLYQGYQKEVLDKEDDNLKKSLYDKAKSNVRIFFILEKIAAQEEIKIEEKDLDEKIDQIASNAKEDIVSVRKRLEEGHMMDSLKEQIIHDKVVAFLLKEARVAKE
ncbi:trigger factor [Candidatus Omnitrophota bacterium]